MLRRIFEKLRLDPGYCILWALELWIFAYSKLHLIDTKSDLNPLSSWTEQPQFTVEPFKHWNSKIGHFYEILSILLFYEKDAFLKWMNRPIVKKEHIADHIRDEI